MREGTLLSTTEVKWIIREYKEQVYANKSDKLDAMGKFLERHKLLKLTQKILNRLPSKKD